MDLKSFCGREESRPYMSLPFSVGEWTYATNGHICIRIPRVPEIGECTEEKLPIAAVKLFDALPSDGFVPLPPIKIEHEEWEECPECDGRGHDHDCPSCQCVCDDCDGTGVPKEGHGTSVGVNDVIFHGIYVAKLQKLPNVAITKPLLEVSYTSVKGVFFRFDGGEGILMPMTRKSEKHIDVTLSDAETHQL